VLRYGVKSDRIFYLPTCMDIGAVAACLFPRTTSQHHWSFVAPANVWLRRQVKHRKGM
jgi:hypothetical protein